MGKYSFIMPKIINATPEDIPQIHQLAYKIWPSAFENILQPKQINYMLEWMYSPNSLTQQMKENHHFLLLEKKQSYIGYCSYHQNQETTFLQKIYILPKEQGKGYGKKMLTKVISKAKLSHSKSLRLNVNRYNNAVKFYQNMGFQILYQEDNPIGNGFYMNDFVMELSL